jgi:hypothetical protein
MVTRSLAKVAMSVMGAILSALFILEGLYARIFGEFLSLAGSPDLVVEAIERIFETDPSRFAWLLIVVGATWPGALAGIWLKMKWGGAALVLVSLSSSLYIPAGSLLAAAVLLLFVAGLRGSVDEPD